jgi:hypothetical protein
MRTVHRDSYGTHGVPRLTAELHDNSERTDPKRIARIMRLAPGHVQVAGIAKKSGTVADLVGWVVSAALAGEGVGGGTVVTFGGVGGVGGGSL